jgi:hypothetical protein
MSLSDSSPARLPSSRPEAPRAERSHAERRTGKRRGLQPGDTVNEWTVLARPGKVRGQSVVLVRCSCGARHTRPYGNVASGRSRSCGDRRKHPKNYATPRASQERAPAPPDAVPSYDAMHGRVRRARGSANEHACVGCGAPAHDWAFTYPDGRSWYASVRPGDGMYGTSVDDYEPKCRSCHRRDDSARHAEARRLKDWRTA